MSISIARIIGGVYSFLGLTVLIGASADLLGKSPTQVFSYNLISWLVPAYFLIAIGILALNRTKNTLISAAVINLLAAPISIWIFVLNRGNQITFEGAIILGSLFRGIPALAISAVVTLLLLKERLKVEREQTLEKKASNALVISLIIIIVAAALSSLSIVRFIGDLSQRTRYEKSKRSAEVSTVREVIITDDSALKCPEVKKKLRFTLSLDAPNERQKFSVDLNKEYANSGIEIMPDRIYLDGSQQSIASEESIPNYIIVTKGNHEIFFDVKLCPESGYSDEDGFNISMFYGLGTLPQGKNNLARKDYKTPQYTLNDFK